MFYMNYHKPLYSYCQYKIYYFYMFYLFKYGYILINKVLKRIMNQVVKTVPTKGK